MTSRTRSIRMNIEVLSTMIIILVCWAVLLVADGVVALVLSWVYKKAFKRIFLWGLISLAVPLILTAYGILIERNRAQVKEVDIISPSLPSAFDGYRVVQISDIHLRSFHGREEVLQRMAATVNQLNPDLICFTGDLVTLSADEVAGFESILSTLKASDGVFAVMGNHDYLLYDGQDSTKRVQNVRRLQESERSMGWRLLLDESAIIRRGTDSIAVVGVENISASPHFPSKGDLSKALKHTEGLFRILLSHDPTHWENEVAAMTNIELTLSGHTHAAQCSLLGWNPSRHIYNHYQGRYRQGGQYLYVNSGLGETIFPARIGVPPEITLLTLKRETVQ